MEPTTGRRQPQGPPAQTNTGGVPAPHPDVEPSTGQFHRVQPSQVPPAAQSPMQNTAVPSTAVQFAKPKKRWLWPLIIVIILAVLAGAAAAAYFLWYQKPEKVLNDALMKFAGTSHVQVKAKTTSDSELFPGPFNVKLKEVNDTYTMHDPLNFQYESSLTVELNGRDYQMAGKFMLLDSGDMYFRLDNVKETIVKLMDDLGGSSLFDSETKAKIDKLQNTWVKVTKDDMGDNAEGYQCAVDKAKALSADTSFTQFVMDSYKANKFVTVKEKVGTKDGNIGLKVALDNDTAEKFVKALDKNETIKQMADCGKSATSSDDSSSSSTSSNVDQPIEDTIKDTTTDITIWVSQFGHELKAVDYDVATKNPSTDSEIAFSTHADLSYDKSVTLTAPSDSVLLKDWMADIEALSEGVLPDPSTSYGTLDDYSSDSIYY